MERYRVRTMAESASFSATGSQQASWLDDPRHCLVGRLASTPLPGGCPRPFRILLCPKDMPQLESFNGRRVAVTGRGLSFDFQVPLMMQLCVETRYVSFLVFPFYA